MCPDFVDKGLVLRRLDPFPLILGPVWLAAITLALWINRPIGALEAVMGSVGVLPVVALCYFDGPAAHVSITRRDLVIANMLIRHRVPRCLIASVASNGLGVVVRLKDESEISIRALEPALESLTSKSDRWYRARAKRLIDALERVPPEVAMEGAVSKSVRYGNLLFGIGVLVAFVAGSWWGLTQ